MGKYLGVKHFDSAVSAEDVSKTTLVKKCSFSALSLHAVSRTRIPGFILLQDNADYLTYWLQRSSRCLDEVSRPWDIVALTMSLCVKISNSQKRLS